LSPLAKLLARLGIDQAVFNAILGRLWGVGAGPVTVLFIAHFLSREQQGFYYTFSSLQALQIFFDLGMAFVIMQFASHEKAHLEWTCDKTLEGVAANKQRLASLLRLAVWWYGVISVLVAVFLLVAGEWFFSTSAASSSGNVTWRIPWALASIGTAGALFLTPIFGILEGCGKIAEIYGIRILQAVVSSLALWVTLVCGGGLYAASACSLVLPLVGAVWLFFHMPFFKNLWQTKSEPGNRISWFKELWPLQWKMSVSAASGYIIVQLVTPVLFRYQGPVLAGQFGMTQRIMDSISTVSFSWVSTKAAPIGSLIARKRYQEVLALHRKSTIQSMSVCLLGFSVFLIGLKVLVIACPSFSARFLPISVTFFLCLNALFSVLSYCVAVLARANKEEPFLVPSLIGAAITALIIFFVAIPHGVLPMSIWMCAAGFVVGVPISVGIYLKYIHKYQKGNQISL